MATPSRKQATSEELLAHANSDRLEIVAGELVEKAAPSPGHSFAEAKLAVAVDPYNRRPGSRGPGGWWIFTEIHVQYYNNGGFTYDNASNQQVSEGTVDGLVAGSLMLIEGFTTAYGTGWHFNGLRPDQVTFGVPSGTSSANTGFVTSTTVANTLNCLTRLTNCGW